LTVSDRRIGDLINDNRILDLKARDLDETEAQSLAAGIALKRVYQKHETKHAISFHRSIRAASRFRDQQDALNRVHSLRPRVQNFHISSKKTAGERSRLLTAFVDAKRALITNARCLTEGVDVPAIDCVMFADPKQSKIDIVQAAGRALRTYPGKKCGYIVVPLDVPEDTNFDTFAETTAFRQIARTITALSTQDERIAEEFRLIHVGRKSKGTIVEIDGDVPIGMKMKLAEFAEAIATRVWESVGRANWKPFEEARDLVRGLGLKAVHGPAGWFNYCKSGGKPVDIPTNPQVMYAEAGWVDWGDWLGTGPIADRDRVYRTFGKAREYARSLKLRTWGDWIAFTKSGKLPEDIPGAPWQTYKDKGWKDIGDWLGTGTVRRAKKSFCPSRRHGLTRESCD
jgi:Helicase conserved C-terminal domain